MKAEILIFLITKKGSNCKSRWGFGTPNKNGRPQSINNIFKVRSCPWRCPCLTPRSHKKSQWTRDTKGVGLMPEFLVYVFRADSWFFFCKRFFFFSEENTASNLLVSSLEYSTSLQRLHTQQSRVEQSRAERERNDETRAKNSLLPGSPPHTAL